MSTRIKLEFDDYRHRRTGYLSNSARYSFVLDNKEWPTVEHYVCSQPFKGEPFEETLRCSPSPWHLHFLIRGKRSSYKENGRVIKKYSKIPLQQNKRRWYLKAINNKFFQNQRIMGRLLNTGNTVLVDLTCPYTGPILENIRYQCRQERFQKNLMFSQQDLKLFPDIQDLSSSILSWEDYAIINGLINAAWKYVKKTNNTCIYVEFLKKVLSDLYPKRSEFIIMLYQTRTPEIIEKMPCFSNIIKQIFEIFRKQDPYQNYDWSGSNLIGEILRWHKIYASPSESDQFFQIVAPNFLLKKPSSFSSMEFPFVADSALSVLEQPSIPNLAEFSAPAIGLELGAAPAAPEPAAEAASAIGLELGAAPAASASALVLELGAAPAAPAPAAASGAALGLELGAAPAASAALGLGQTPAPAPPLAFEPAAASAALVLEQTPETTSAPVNEQRLQ